MKKLVAILLVLMVLAAVPAAVMADGTVYTEGTMYYTVGDGTITIVGCFGKNESITVPNSIGGIPVNTIASGAFANNKYLKVLYLPDTITNVEGGAIGGGVSVIYNYNVTEPVATLPPEMGDEGEVVVVPSVEVEEEPAPEQPGWTTGSGTTDLGDEPSGGTGSTYEPYTGGTGSSGIVYGSGDADLDGASGSGWDEDNDLDGTAVLEGDVDLDAEEEEASETPKPVVTEAPARTAPPVVTAAPTEEPKKEAVPEPEAVTKEEKTVGGIPLLTILLLAAWIIVLVTIVILLRVNAKRKAQMRRAARARARARRPEDSDTDR